MRKGHFMELPELEYFTLEKAINFIYEKTNKNLSKSDILEYAINGFFQIGIEVEIVDNVLFKCGRLRISNTKLSNSTKIIHKKENQHDDGKYIYLSDKFNYISLFKGTGKIYQIEQDNEFYFTTINDCKVNCTTLIRLEPYYLRDLRGIIEQNDSICSMNFEYFSLESLARDEEDIAATFDFIHVSPNNKTCQLKLATADLIITREDILMFIGADKKGSREDHILEIERLKKEIEEKQKIIDSLSLTNPKGRISSPQKQLFALLVKRCYSDIKSRNKLFDVINADLKSLEIRNADISADTFYKLIDESNDIIKAIFPPKKS